MCKRTDSVLHKHETETWKNWLAQHRVGTDSRSPHYWSFWETQWLKCVLQSFELEGKNLFIKQISREVSCCDTENIGLLWDNKLFQWVGVLPINRTRETMNFLFVGDTCWAGLLSDSLLLWFLFLHLGNIAMKLTKPLCSSVFIL